jgi:tetratricopeptide (TPR) repeat protein
MVSLISPDRVRSELVAIEQGREFRASTRHRKFLRYLVEQSLDGRASSLKEISLGIAVFDRPPATFDPMRDTIVRVEARRLRSRLSRHYSDEGKDSAVIISLQPGSYVPVVKERERTTSSRSEYSSDTARDTFVDPAQRDLYLRARIAFQQRTPDGYRLAETLFTRLVSLAPNSPYAHCGCARVLLAHAGMSVVAVRAALPTAREHAELALRADASFGEAHALIAQVAFLLDHDFASAETSFRRAVQCAPNLAYVHHVYAFGLLCHGRFEDAEQAFSLARKHDPLDLHIRLQSALVHFYERDFSEAIARWEEVLEIRPDNLIAATLIGATYLCCGEPKLALERYEAARVRVPEHPIGWAGMAQAHALMGEAHRANEILSGLIQMRKVRYVSPYLFAMIYTRLRDADAAFAWLKNSADEPDFNFVCAGVDPTFDSLHADPRWSTLMRNHGFNLAPNKV